jgi:preprotein translocase subunit SecY
LIYYLLIIAFNYFYTSVFWDPEKISEQLRKASVSIVNVTPGKRTDSVIQKMLFELALFWGGFIYH